MADDVSKTGGTDRSQSNVNDVHFWELALYASEAHLRSLIAGVGKSIEAIRVYLRT